MRGKTPELSVIESSPLGATINLKTYGMWVEDLTEKQETYQRITLPTSHTGEIGRPMLPTVSKLVAIPATAGVTVTVESKEERVYEDYLVYPTQNPEVYGGLKDEFQIDEEFYEKDTQYPIEISEVGPPGIMNDVRLVQLHVRPFRYNPKKKELTVYTDISVRLDYTGYDDRNALCNKRNRFSPQWERIYRSLILNFDDIYGPVRSLSVIPDPDCIAIYYLIICADDFFDTTAGTPLKEFMEWKRRKGLIVDAVNLNDIVPPASQGDTSNAEAVRDYIRDEWRGGSPLYYKDYVLLIGDAPVHGYPCTTEDIAGKNPILDSLCLVQCAFDSLVPTKNYLLDHIAYDPIFSDYYYQLIAGFDDYPDLCIGRWSVEDEYDLDTCVRKVFAYEKEPATAWNQDKALLVAGKVQRPSLYEEPWEVKDDICNTLPSAPYEVDLVYGEQSGNNDAVSNSLEMNGGVGIVNYLGHGLWTEWAEWSAGGESYDTADIRELENGGYCPLVYNVCCLSGNIAAPDTIILGQPIESMVESWTRYSEGGAAAAFAASSPIEIEVSNALDRAIFAGHFDHILNCGMAVNYAKSYVIGEWEESVHARDLARAGYWIGDPELDVWRSAAHESYIASISLNPQTQKLDVRVMVVGIPHVPSEGTKVCLYRDGGGYRQARYTDESGVAHFNPPTTVGTYRLTATNQWDPDYCIVPACSTFYYSGTFGQREGPFSNLAEWNLEPLRPGITRSQAVISYSVAGRLFSEESEFVELSLFDVTGREVSVLASKEHVPGYYTIIWDGKDNYGASLPSGVYFVRMRSADFDAKERLLLLR
ncbi:hypothetical protein JXM67_07065 [candidate division WOR-3 bacterium]|nr:hypothetical protein [candidate division WOR-3 bacterium]